MSDQQNATTYQYRDLSTSGMVILKSGEYRLVCDLGTSKNGKSRVAITKEQADKIISIAMPAAAGNWEQFGSVSWGWCWIEMGKLGTIVLGKAPYLVSA